MNNEEEKIEFQLKYSTSFKKDLKGISKQPQKLKKVTEVLSILKDISGIPQKMKPHLLTVNYKGSLECHIEPDLLIIWVEYEEEKEISLLRLGSHAELFG